ncbi:zf-HC2 domain-containing protein [Aromatoleum toluclasticum]|uniref:anti-sigma factor family protein n=1 Tax=Aromatoleum toluclasticum TaxID=92003 RepID=UPI00035EE738|nr:zf-HC2 domain-containing protein [Aromatoleum toluclasticum]MCC4116263.1 zf-HC2 domain-containing protein [Aromatoleum toluclasticum]
MMNCREVTRLISESQERALTLRERLSLMLHTMACSGCANYGKHLEFLRKTARRLREGGAGDER